MEFNKEIKISNENKSNTKLKMKSSGSQRAQKKIITSRLGHVEGSISFLKDKVRDMDS